jgi:hypothetical protein
LPANIGLGWNGFAWTKTLAYYENPKITAVISFTVQAPGGAFTDNEPNLRVAALLGAPLGPNPIIFTHFRLGCKSLAGRNTLAYFGGATKTEQKKVL